MQELLWNQFNDTENMNRNEISSDGVNLPSVIS